MKPSTLWTLLAPAIQICSASPTSNPRGLIQDAALYSRAKTAPSISHADILEAFKADGHPDATPRQTWHDENNTIHQMAYDFDTDEWNAMHDKLLAKASGTSKPNALLSREEERPSSFFCYGDKDHAWAYTYTLSAVTTVVCSGFAYAIEFGGRTQIIEKTGLKDIENKPARAIFQYTWNFFKWGSTGACATAMQYGITNQCNVRRFKADTQITILTLNVTYRKTNLVPVVEMRKLMDSVVPGLPCPDKRRLSQLSRSGRHS